MKKPPLIRFLEHPLVDKLTVRLPLSRISDWAADSFKRERGSLDEANLQLTVHFISVPEAQRIDQSKLPPDQRKYVKEFLKTGSIRETESLHDDLLGKFFVWWADAEPPERRGTLMRAEQIAFMQGVGATLGRGPDKTKSETTREKLMRKLPEPAKDVLRRVRDDYKKIEDEADSPNAAGIAKALGSMAAVQGKQKVRPEKEIDIRKPLRDAVLWMEQQGGLHHIRPATSKINDPLLGYLAGHPFVAKVTEGLPQYEQRYGKHILIEPLEHIELGRFFTFDLKERRINPRFLSEEPYLAHLDDYLAWLHNPPGKKEEYKLRPLAEQLEKQGLALEGAGWGGKAIVSAKTKEGERKIRAMLEELDEQGGAVSNNPLYR